MFNGCSLRQILTPILYGPQVTTRILTLQLSNEKIPMYGHTDSSLEIKQGILYLA